MDPEQTQPTRAPDLAEVSSRMREDFVLLRGALERRGGELRDATLRFIDEHPIASVAAAFGAGYVLAGGLFSRTTGRALGFGTRFFIGQMLKQAFAGAGLGWALTPERNP
jgi:hypothetical protein